jgi:hypothetical protein
MTRFCDRNLFSIFCWDYPHESFLYGFSGRKDFESGRKDFEPGRKDFESGRKDFEEYTQSRITRKSLQKILPVE